MPITVFSATGETQQGDNAQDCTSHSIYLKLFNTTFLLTAKRVLGTVHLSVRLSPSHDWTSLRAIPFKKIRGGSRQKNWIPGGGGRGAAEIKFQGGACKIKFRRGEGRKNFLPTSPPYFLNGIALRFVCESIISGRIRHWRIKSKFLYFLFEQPNILCTLDELSWSNFFSGVYHPQDTQDEKVSLSISGVFLVIIDREISSEVCEMLGSSNPK